MSSMWVMQLYGMKNPNSVKYFECNSINPPLKTTKRPTQIQVQNQNKKICMTIQSAIVCCYGGYKAAEKKNTNCNKSERDQ